MEKETKKLKEFQKWFDKYIAKGFGPKCKGFTWRCPACHAHFVKEVFDDFVEVAVDLDKWSEKQEKKQKKGVKKKK